MKIGKRLRSLRIENGYSATKIAEELNISESTYRKYETDKSSPNLNLVEQLAAIYQIFFQEVVSQTDNIFNKPKALEMRKINKNR